LNARDIDDVGQTVWLLLIENIASLREPAALPGWLATTTRHECLRVLRAARRLAAQSLLREDQMPPDLSASLVEQEMINADRDVALRAAIAELPAACHELLSMLISDPPVGYAEISSRLGIPVGSIGPTRARCLEKLRRSPHLAGLLADQMTSDAARADL
jgi:RNA polymerase sigma factor (sigma-70 family)